MSRSGYSDGDCYDEHDMLRMEGYRQAVRMAIKGARGQKFLRELLEALESMDKKELCAYDLQTENGHCCTLGAIGFARGIDMLKMDPEDHRGLAKLFDIAASLVREIEFENDDDLYFFNTGLDYSWWMRKHGMTFDEANKKADEARWTKMHAWVKEHIID